MGTARREVDDLLLVQAKYRMDALADQQRQMSERAESAVGHQHIAALQQGKNPAHASHVMRPQRRRENLQQQPGAGVEQRQDVGHREAAALGLVARLAEVGLQRGDIGHGERRAVDQQDAMAEPESRDLGGRDQDLDHRAEDGLEDGQREPARAWQKALAVKARPASKETWVKAVLPWRTWMRNQWIMAAGVKRQLSHHEWPAWRQAW